MSFAGIDIMNPYSSEKPVIKRTTLDFFDAVLSGDLKKIEKLLKHGVDINATDGNGHTALQTIAQKNHTKPVTRHNGYNLVTTYFDNYPTTAEFLIKHGALIDTIALTLTCQQESTELLSLFIENSPPKMVKENGYKLLKSAFQSTSIDCIEMLIKNGALTELTSSNLENLELLVERLPYSSTQFINEALNTAFIPFKAGDNILKQFDNNINVPDLTARQKIKSVSIIFNAITMSPKATLTKDHKNNLMARLQKSQQKVRHGF